MKRVTASLLMLTLLALPGVAQLKDTYIVVKQSDYSGAESFSVMTEKEFKSLDAELRKESFMATRARIMAAKAWEQDKEKEGRFPAGLISTRHASAVGRAFVDRAEADDQLMKLEHREVEKKRDEAEREKVREANRKKIRANAVRAGGQNPNNSVNRETQKRLDERKKERDQQNELREYDRDLARDALQAEAIAVYQAQIDLIKSSPSAEPDQPDQPAQP